MKMQKIFFFLSISFFTYSMDNLQNNHKTGGTTLKISVEKIKSNKANPIDRVKRQLSNEKSSLDPKVIIIKEETKGQG
jgi:hypothetical protein